MNRPPPSPASPLVHAPDVTIPLRFMIVGIVSLLTTVLLLAWHPDVLANYHYNQHVVAITHLFILGFALSVVSGAMYQLVPVALETRLHSERLARWHFPIHFISAAGMVWMFWIWDMKQVGHFGSGLAIGVGFFIWNLVRTLRQVRGWTVVSFGIASTLFWLASVLIAGLAVTAGKCTYEMVERPDLHPLLAAPLIGLRATAGFLSQFEPLAVMHAHAHLGILGVFLLLTIGIGYKLVPMFLISEIQSTRRAWASLWFLNLGLAATFLAILVQSPFKLLAALIVVAGLALYGLELRAIVHARRRQSLDAGLRAFLFSQALLAPASILGLWLARPGVALNETIGRLENAYGFITLFGVVALAILGMLYKILPFLVWFVAYGAHVGRGKTPSLQEMYSTPFQIAGLGLWILGLVIGLVAIGMAHPEIARIAALFLIASLACFLVNAARILSHLVLPRTQRTPVRSHRSVFSIP